MDRKTILCTVNSKIDVECNKHDNWRQQHWLTCINQIPKKIHWNTWNLWFKQPYHKSNVKLIDIKSYHFQHSTKRIFYWDVLPCPIKFETRYKYIRNLKIFELEKYVQDFEALPISLLYSFDDPNDQLGTLSKLILNVINEHALLM